MIYEIWEEGHIARGSQSKAQKLGEMEADTFKEACKKLVLTLNEETQRLFNSETPSIWGRHLFPTEEEAREAFG